MASPSHTETVHLALNVDVYPSADTPGELIARCRELDIVTCADSVSELREMVDDMFATYFAANRKRGTLTDLLRQLAEHRFARSPQLVSTDAEPCVRIVCDTHLHLPHRQELVV